MAYYFNEVSHTFNEYLAGSGIFVMPIVFPAMRQP